MFCLLFQQCNWRSLFKQNANNIRSLYTQCLNYSGYKWISFIIYRTSDITACIRKINQQKTKYIKAVLVSASVSNHGLVAAWEKKKKPESINKERVKKESQQRSKDIEKAK